MMYDKDLNDSKLYGKVEAKLLEEKRTQRMKLLTQAGTRPSLKSRSGNSFNSYICDFIPI